MPALGSCVMAAKRAFDPDKLFELLAEEPTAHPNVLADKLTCDNKTKGILVTVTPRLVIAAISRHREAWEAVGLDLSARMPARCELVRMLVENSGRKIADQYQMDTIIVKLRHVDRMRQGKPLPRYRVGAAQAWEAKRFATHTVVALTRAGRPFIRPAMEHELDPETGNLIEIVCAKSVQLDRS